MKHYTCYTLVDITETGVIRDSESQQLDRNQQRNWETVLQCISLLAQPMEISQWIPCQCECVEKQFEFGSEYRGPHRVWIFNFSVEHEDVFSDGQDQFARLDRVIDRVPVITYLTETARFLLPILHTSGPIKNIYFKNRGLAVK
jgi:hypothetical protein